MNTATPLASIQTLGRFLEEHLHASLPDSTSVQVRCDLQRGTLLVMAQHPGKCSLDAARVLTTLKQGLAEYSPPLTREARLFVRKAGEKQPYARASWQVQSAEAIEPPDAAETEPTEDEEAGSQPAIPLYWMAAGVAAGLGFLLGIGYIVSRPCVLGECSELTVARELYAQHQETLRAARSTPEVLKAQEQLTSAVETLESIPFWAGSHREAEGFLRAYEVPQERIAQLLEAFDIANQAAIAAQNPPHPLSTWQEVRQLWETGIAKLERIPESPATAALLGRKQIEYRTNLQAIEARIATETTAQRQLQEGVKQLDLAQTRQSVAASEEGWQEVQSTWQTAIASLERVPQGTMAYEESRQLLDLHRPKFEEVRQRRVQETVASQLYRQALQLADRARSFEQKQDWIQAGVYWRQAIDRSKQVPINTSYHLQVEPLMEAYQNALGRVEERIALVDKMQQARSLLASICTNSPKACQYRITPELITVQLNREYVRRVRYTVMSARTDSNPQTLRQVDAHVQKLQSALEAIGDNTKIPIAVYDPFGKLIDTYQPLQG